MKRINLPPRPLMSATRVLALWALLTAPLSARPLSAPAEPLASASYDHPFMWAVQCPDLPKLKLVGTMHIPDPRFARLSPLLLEAIKEADAVYGELDLSDKASLTAQLTPHMMLPSGETLESKLPPDLYTALKGYLQLKGSSIVPFTLMKPEALEILLPMIELMPLMMKGYPNLDEELLKRARDAGKEVGGIETVQEQLESLFAKSEEESVESLRHTLKRLKELHQEGKSPLDSMTRAFFSGDEGRLWREIEAELDGAPPSQLKTFDRLLRQRNHRMAKRIIHKIRGTKRHFLFAFGTAHFIGKESVIELLKSFGCKTERVSG